MLQETPPGPDLGVVGGAGVVWEEVVPELTVKDRGDSSLVGRLGLRMGAL